MSEKLLPCPFCGGRASIFKTWVPRSKERVACCADQACLGYQQEQDEQGGWAVSSQTDAEAIAAWNRRTPAPEGEAWRTVPVEPTEAMIAAANALWGDGTGVNYVQLDPEDFYAAMLAASPVVPVGESREELTERQKDIVRALVESVADELSDTLGCRSQEGGGGPSQAERDHLRDCTAIIAALCPTDTGRE
jgi:hypothetical protein